MKFKIFCVLVIAASVAVVLVLSLKDKTASSVLPDQVAVGERPQGAQKAVKGQPLPPAVPVTSVTPEEAAKVTAEKKESKEAAPEVPVVSNPLRRAAERAAYGTADINPQATPDEVDIIKSSVTDPSSFGRLSPAKKTMALSLALNMNEEQEVMLTSYLEAQQQLFRDPQTFRLGNALSESNFSQFNTTGRPGSSLTEIGDMVEILATEVKEIKNLRQQFLSALTKQQQEKLSALPVAQTF